MLFEGLDSVLALPSKTGSHLTSKAHFLEVMWITKTSRCNEDPITPHFYIVKLGFTGVYIIFLFLLLYINCGYSLEPPHRGGANVYSQSMFEQK